MVKKSKIGGGQFNLKLINEYISKFLGITPIVNGILYLLFIIFSLIIIIELILKKNTGNIAWYTGYTHFFINILLVILVIPLIPLLINIIFGIIRSFLSRKKRQIGPPHEGIQMLGGFVKEEYMNYGFFKIVIDGFKLVLIDSFHTFVTFFLVISYFSLVEHTDYFKNFLNFVNFIFFTLIFLYALTILFKINNATKQENILGFIILLVSLNFIFSPLFFILTKTIEWAKNSDNFFVNLIILILYSLAGLGINKLRWQFNDSLQELNEAFYNVLSDVKKFSQSKEAAGFDDVLNVFIDKIF